MARLNLYERQRLRIAELETILQATKKGALRSIERAHLSALAAIETIQIERDLWKSKADQAEAALMQLARQAKPKPPARVVPHPSPIRNVEVLWCGNGRLGRNAGWVFPARVRRQIIEDCAGLSVLHLFGGRSTFGTRLDIDPIVRPDVIGDAWLPPFAKDSFDVVVLDPPYVHFNAQEKDGLFRVSNWIARKRVIWFSTIWMSRGASQLRFEKGWLVRVGDTCHVRALQYFASSPSSGKQAPSYVSRGRALKYNRWLAQPQGLELHAVAENEVQRAG